MLCFYPCINILLKLPHLKAFLIYYDIQWFYYLYQEITIMKLWSSILNLIEYLKCYIIEFLLKKDLIKEIISLSSSITMLSLLVRFKIVDIWMEFRFPEMHLGYGCEFKPWNYYLKHLEVLGFAHKFRGSRIFLYLPFMCWAGLMFGIWLRFLWFW